MNQWKRNYIIKYSWSPTENSASDVAIIADLNRLICLPHTFAKLLNYCIMLLWTNLLTSSTINYDRMLTKIENEKQFYNFSRELREKRRFSMLFWWSLRYCDILYHCFEIFKTSQRYLQIIYRIVRVKRKLSNETIPEIHDVWMIMC